MANFFGNMKVFRQATKECLESEAVDAKDREVLREGLWVLNVTDHGVKAAVVGGILLLVDWKKRVSAFRREVPLALVGFTFCALAEYGGYYFTQSKTKTILNKYTGYKDGVFVNPDKYKAMRANFEKKNKNAKGNLL
jgi:hypothetical protein